MKSKKILAPVIIIAIIIAAIIMTILMRGETKTSGQNPENVIGESLICENQSTIYPFFGYDNARARNLRISANFYKDELDTIALTYTLYYDTPGQIEASEAHNHADMGISFGKNNLGADPFNVHFTKLNDSIRMELYITFKDLTPIAAKYFMIELYDEITLPKTLSEYHRNYKNQNFTCKIK